MKKEFGVGSISLVLFIITILWSVNINGLKGFCLGDAVLKFMDLPAWSTCSNGKIGIHFTIFYTIVFLIPAIILGYKFPNHRYAKGGKIGSIIGACILIISLIFLMF
ncbi:hypothetical protein [Aminipila sp.]|uniref:hypothetical protein n=1 Tax=Aminipila sp. TaxID=2060095 RepID=UPI0028A26AB6|nr:hypothetical protein [Aminipila sp.]